MAHLTDMDELLQRIPNKDIINYMEEALKCYNAGAYRGCIVMSYIALFDDLVRKLSEMRQVNNKAREIHDEVVRRQNSQDVFENYLLEQLASNKIISELDASMADIIRVRRNKAAHASGHSPSAEEARFVYHEVISIFLSKKTFSSKVLADEILARAENNNFFPSGIIDDIKGVVEHETKMLHSDAYPYFITKLLDGIKAPTGTFSQNVSFFIAGLTALDKETSNKILVSKLFEKKLDDETYASQCISCISVNPKLLDMLSSTALDRLRKRITENTETTPNTSSINSPASLFENIYLKNRAKIEVLRSETLDFLKKHSYLSISPLIAQASDSIWPEYVNMLISKAGSSNFDNANNFSKQFPVIDSNFAKKANGADLLKLYSAVIRANTWGAWAAQSVVSSRFETFVTTKNKLKAFMSNQKTDAATILEQEFPNEYTPESFLSKYIEEDA